MTMLPLILKSRQPWKDERQTEAMHAAQAALHARTWCCDDYVLRVSRERYEDGTSTITTTCLPLCDSKGRRSHF